jgi:hypothetical protein
MTLAELERLFNSLESLRTENAVQHQEILEKIGKIHTKNALLDQRVSNLEVMNCDEKEEKSRNWGYILTLVIALTVSTMEFVLLMATGRIG